MSTLLIDASHALHIAHIEGVLGAAIAGVLAFELAMGFFFGFGFFHGRKLGLGEDDAVLGDFGFQGFQALLHGLQIVALPHAANAGWRDGQPALSQLVGDAHLPESRLLDGERHDGALDLFGDAVLEHRLLAGDFGQCDLAAFFIKLLEAVKAVPASLFGPPTSSADFASRAIWFKRAFLCSAAAIPPSLPMHALS